MNKTIAAQMFGPHVVEAMLLHTTAALLLYVGPPTKARREAGGETMTAEEVKAWSAAHGGAQPATTQCARIDRRTLGTDGILRSPYGAATVQWGLVFP